MGPSDRGFDEGLDAERPIVRCDQCGDFFEASEDVSHEHGPVVCESCWRLTLRREADRAARVDFLKDLLLAPYRPIKAPPTCRCGLPLLWETGELCAQCARADADMETLLEKESA